MRIVGSACAASIIRTTYAEAINESPDRTYNLCAVGLWTYAEIAIGIIVACLPVTPRFFKSIRNSLHFGYIFKSANESSSDSAGLKWETKSSAKLKGRFTKDHSAAGSNDTHNPRSQLQGDYYTLTEVHSVSSDRDISGIQIPAQALGRPVSLSDLEDGIRIERTIEVEIEPSMGDPRTANLSEQKYKLCW